MVKSEESLVRTGKLVKSLVCNGCSSPINTSDPKVSRLVLKDIPPVDYFLEDIESASNVSRHNLCVIKCPKCKLVQIESSPPPQYFYDNYIYTSSSSPDMRDNFLDLQQKIFEEVEFKTKPIKMLDIGCNDGLFLKLFATDRRFDLYGTDPSPVALSAVDGSYKLHHEYFPAEKTLLSAPYDVVVGTNSLAHIPSIGQVFQRIYDVLAEEGVFIMEVSDFDSMAKEGAWDYIYHEHLYYYTRESILNLFQLSGLEVYKFEPIKTKGGSLRVFARKSQSSNPTISKSSIKVEENTFTKLEQAFEGCLSAYDMISDLINKSPGSLYGYGACATGSVTISQHDLFKNLVAIVDDNERRQGLFSPWSAVPVVPIKDVSFKEGDIVFVFAWRFIESIRKNIAFYCQENNLPYPKVVNAMHPKV